MSVHSGKSLSPPEGYRPLNEVAEEYGITRRQLWRKVRAGEVEGEKFGRFWYVAPGAEIPIHRRFVDEKTEKSIKRDLLRDDPPKKIARRYDLSKSTVYEIRRKHKEELWEREKEWGQYVNNTKTSGIHLRGGAVLKAITTEMPDGVVLNNADERLLAENFPEVRVYADLRRNVLYISEEDLQKIDRAFSDLIE